MKIINLDKFKAIQKVSLSGQEYEVYGMTVGQFIDGTLQEKLKAANDGDPKQIFCTMLEALEKMTNIPVEVLKDQNFKVLETLLSIAQGNDPEETQEKSEGNG